MARPAHWTPENGYTEEVIARLERIDAEIAQRRALDGPHVPYDPKAIRLIEDDAEPVHGIQPWMRRSDWNRMP